MNHGIGLVSTRQEGSILQYKENEDILTYIPHDATKLQGRLL
jgi:predicted RNA binding protein YcfA (HicA-like mRNA interferase family)